VGAHVVVGRFGAPYGIKGWLKLVSFTDPVQNILHYRPLRVQRDEHWHDVPVDEIKSHGKGFVAHVCGVDDRTAAERLTGREIAIPEEALPQTAADEYYWKDLIGLTVVMRNGTALGTVDRLFEVGPHDVLVVARDGEDVMIPFVDAYVREVDLARKRIEVDWDESY
jgi:16S rRNA processing protein RimM